MIILTIIGGILLIVGIVAMFIFAHEAGYQKCLEERDEVYGKMYNACFDICFDLIVNDLERNLSATKLYSRDQIIKELEFFHEETENINGYERR